MSNLEKKKNIYVFMLEKLKHLKQVAAVVIVFILQEAEETTGNNAQLGMWAWQSEILNLFM